MPYNMHLLTLVLAMSSPLWCAKIRSDADRDEIEKGVEFGLFRKNLGQPIGHVVVDYGDARQHFSVELTPEGERLALKMKEALADAGITNERGVMNLLAA